GNAVKIPLGVLIPNRRTFTINIRQEQKPISTRSCFFGISDKLRKIALILHQIFQPLQHNPAVISRPANDEAICSKCITKRFLLLTDDHFTCKLANSTASSYRNSNLPRQD